MKLFSFPSFPMGIIIGSLIGSTTLSIRHNYEMREQKNLYESQIRLVQEQKQPIYEMKVEISGTNPTVFMTNLPITVPLRYLTIPTK